MKISTLSGIQCIHLFDMAIIYSTKNKTFIECNGNKLEVPVGKTIAEFEGKLGYIDGYMQCDHDYCAMFVFASTLKIYGIDTECLTVIGEHNEVI